MNGSAMALMIVSILLVWGGLILSIIHLVKNPDVPLESLPNDIDHH